MKVALPLLFFLLACVSSAQAFVAFSIADTTPVLFQHANSEVSSIPSLVITPTPVPSSDPLPGSVFLGNGTFAWGSLDSDTTTNTAEFGGGRFQASDWGGVGTFTSTVIDVSNFLSMDIRVLYSGNFNTSAEFSNFFYILDGVRTDFGAGVEDATALNEDVSLFGVDLSGVNSLQVGFSFSHNGVDNDFAVEQFSVTLNTPEPSSALLLSLGLIGLGRRRRMF